ncbi:MAG: replication-associated recombination protein A [Ruminococcaceae bacterium]|nr:replication-associated recombination protein A [Oscillospiraceae bacterium]
MNNKPLADRMRPTEFSDIVGQKHLFGEKGALSAMLDRDHLPNLIFYGPPGTGKTTAANIIARRSGLTMHKLNATSCSLSDVRQVIAETDTLFGRQGVLLYLDEIQYFNRKQQQSLLEFIEDGRLTLIASTTENPYYYLYGALLSRSLVFEFKPVQAEDMSLLFERALAFLNEENGLSKTCDPLCHALIASACGGDVRKALITFESAYFSADDRIERQHLDPLLPSGQSFDKSGDSHFDLMSALQKSIRGSDPDAAVFYLAAIVEGGDMLAACRRLQVIASEDIGLAYPMAPAIVKACVDSALALGLPEARIPLAHAAVLLATAPKSNSAYLAYDAAAQDIAAGKAGIVPELFKAKNADQYKYPHDYPMHWVDQQYLPPNCGPYYTFGENKNEQAAKAYWDAIKKKK